MAFIDELAQKLVDDSVGILNTTIFLSTKSTKPPVPPPGLNAEGPEAIVIVDTGGTGRLRRQREEYQRPSASLTATAPTAPRAYALAARAHASLDGKFNITISGTRYLWLRAKQEPTDMGPDSKGGYPQFVFNVEAMKDPS